MDQWPNQNRDPAIYGNKWQQQHKPQLLWDSAKAVLRGKYIAIQAYLKKEEQFQMNSGMSQLSKLGKEEQMRPKVSRWRDIIKIREEIN